MNSSDPSITPEMVAEHGLSTDEYDRILKILGRAPNLTELGIFSAMWSEHFPINLPKNGSKPCRSAEPA